MPPEGSMLRSVLVGVVVLLVVACGYEREEEALQPSDLAIAKIRVFRDGRITLDEKVVSLEELPAKLSRLKENSGVVWYYRENGGSEPHPNAVAVIQRVIDARLPVSMSSEADFSTVVLPDGTIKPRK
jgi:hypothetical protein